MAEVETALTENQPDADGQQGADKQVLDGGSGTEVEDELGALLGEVDATDAKEDVKSEQDDDDLKSVVSSLQKRVQGMEDKDSRVDSDAALERSVETMIAANDDLKSVSKDAVEAILRLEADRDPRIRTAFFEQKANPVAWSKIEKALGVKVAGMLKAPDSTVTAAKNAANASAQGISTTLSSGDEDTGPSQAVLAEEYRNGKIWDRLQRETGYRRPN